MSTARDVERMVMLQHFKDMFVPNGVVDIACKTDSAKKVIMNYPESFITTITKTYGTVGQQWLDELPTLIDSVTRNWQLSDILNHTIT